jgi:hypothetical protein
MISLFSDTWMHPRYISKLYITNALKKLQSYVSGHTLDIGCGRRPSVPFSLHEEPRDYFRFTPYSLHLLLQENGFVLEHIHRRGGWWGVVGSFLSQALYDWANPPGPSGKRNSPRFWVIFIAPLCALTQLFGYMSDLFFTKSRYTLGYVVAATYRPTSE